MFQYIDELLASSTGRIIVALLVVILSVVFSQIVSRYMKRKNERAVDPGEKTRLSFIRYLMTAVILLFGFGLAIYIIPSLRKLAVSLFAGAGVIAIIIGFASQKALGNLVAGIIITIYKPFRIGDWIEVGTDAGIVEDITLRHTVIRDFQNLRIIIPNSILSDATIKNQSIVDEKVRKHIQVGISYTSNIDKALRILQKTCEKHPLCLDMRTAKEKEEKIPKVKTRVLQLNDSSVDLRAWVWASSPDAAFEMSCDLYKEIKQLFDKNGIEIPFPHRTVYVRKDAPKRKK